MPALTDRARLIQAFAELELRGYATLAGSECCNTCSVAELDDGDPKQQYVFWHSQNEDAFELLNADEVEADEDAEPRYGDYLIDTMHLGWSGDSAQICAVLRSHGLIPRYDGNPTRKIEVLSAPQAGALS